MVTPGVVISVVPICDLDDKLETSWCTLVVVCTLCDMIYGVVIWFVKVMVDSPTVTAGLMLLSAIVMNVYICL